MKKYSAVINARLTAGEQLAIAELLRRGQHSSKSELVRRLIRMEARRQGVWTAQGGIQG